MCAALELKTSRICDGFQCSKWESSNHSPPLVDQIVLSSRCQSFVWSSATNRVLWVSLNGTTFGVAKRGRSAMGARHPRQPQCHSTCRLAPVRWTDWFDSPQLYRKRFPMLKTAKETFHKSAFDRMAGWPGCFGFRRGQWSSCHPVILSSCRQITASPSRSRLACRSSDVPADRAALESNGTPGTAESF